MKKVLALGETILKVLYFDEYEFKAVKLFQLVLRLFCWTMSSLYISSVFILWPTDVIIHVYEETSSQSIMLKYKKGKPVNNKIIQFRVR